ncbi:alpha/beta fold hydrolase [Streptomyces sp. NPDC057575]|uniref:alpha/beta fold hydrolase n=1 Tax=unclassified Streptomyces TaxID=2593676 RepID=UPI00368856B4
MSCLAGRTVVLVHGAFTDASSYAAVIPLLLREGLDVVAPAVPNRGLGGDSAYVASVVRAIPGPVVLVGHGYGGAVITVAGVEDNVMALVYLAGYALDEGECLGELQGKFPAPPLAGALVRTQVSGRGPGGTETEVSVDVARFPALLAAGIDSSAARVLAVSQRPLADRALTEDAPVAAWQTKPSWGLVAAQDRAIDPDLERYGYLRAGMTRYEIDSSHLVMLARPETVVRLILEAVEAV